MHYSVKFAVGLLGTTALALGGMPAAYAAAFGPATGSAEVNGTPAVDTTVGMYVYHVYRFADLLERRRRLARGNQRNVKRGHQRYPDVQRNCGPYGR